MSEGLKPGTPEGLEASHVTRENAASFSLGDPVRANLLCEEQTS
jgi:hypothetical protein